MLLHVYMYRSALNQVLIDDLCVFVHYSLSRMDGMEKGGLSFVKIYYFAKLLGNKLYFFQPH